MEGTAIDTGFSPGTSSIISDHPNLLLARELLNIMKLRGLSADDICVVTATLAKFSKMEHRKASCLGLSQFDMDEVERRMDREVAAMERAAAAAGNDFKIILGGK